MAEMRSSINTMLSVFRELNAGGVDASLTALFNKIESEIKKGILPEEQRALAQISIVRYHTLKLTKAIHLTPQATFPKARSGRKNIRADLMFWVPDYSEFCIVVECDSYQYHDNKQSFDRDRQRSRSLQSLGFKVLQYSGGEIYNDPIQTSFDLYTHLGSELKQLSQRHGKDLHANN